MAKSARSGIAKDSVNGGANRENVELGDQGSKVILSGSQVARNCILEPTRDLGSSTDTAKPVFAITIPLSHAPTMNVYSGLKGWAKGRLRTEVDFMLLEVMTKMAFSEMEKALANGRRRRVVVTRFSSREPDEVASADLLGAKIIIDRMVHAGVLAGDSRKHLVREAGWTQVKPKAGKLLVEVFDL